MKSTNEIFNEIKILINAIPEDDFPQLKESENNWYQYCLLVKEEGSFYVKICNETFEGFFYSILNKLSDDEVKLLIVDTLEYELDPESINNDHVVNYDRKITMDLVIEDFMRKLENDAYSFEFPYE